MNTTSRTIGNGMEAARETLNQAGERMDEATRGARRTAAEAAQEAATYGRKQAAEAMDAAGGLARTATKYARENPGQAILIGLGGLLLAGMLFRRR